LKRVIDLCVTLEIELTTTTLLLLLLGLILSEIVNSMKRESGC